MPKTTSTSSTSSSSAKRAGYAQTASSPCTTPERRRRADGRRAGKRDATYRPTAAERLLASSEGCESPAAERRERREVRREVDALLDVHRHAPARDARYTPTRAELERDREDEAADARRERRVRKAPRRLRAGGGAQAKALEQGLLRDAEAAAAAVAEEEQPLGTISPKRDDDVGHKDTEDAGETATTPREHKDEKGCVIC